VDFVQKKNGTKHLIWSSDCYSGPGRLLWALCLSDCCAGRPKPLPVLSCYKSLSEIQTSCWFNWLLTRFVDLLVASLAEQLGWLTSLVSSLACSGIFFCTIMETGRVHCLGTKRPCTAHDKKWHQCKGKTTKTLQGRGGAEEEGRRSPRTFYSEVQGSWYSAHLSQSIVGSFCWQGRRYSWSSFKIFLLSQYTRDFFTVCFLGYVYSELIKYYATSWQNEDLNASYRG